MKKKRPRLTRAKKEQRIWKLHEDGYGIAEIAEEVGVSATTASKVIRQREELLAPKEKSARSQALLLYRAGAGVTSVAIQIDIPVEEAEGYLQEFHQAEQLDYLENLRRNLGPRFPHFLSLAQELADRDMSIQEMDEAIICAKRNREQQEVTAELGAQHRLLRNQVESLKLAKQNLLVEKGDLDEQIYELKESLDLVKSEYDIACLNTEAKERQADDIETIVNSKMKASRVCLEIENIVDTRVRVLLENRRTGLIILISAIIHVISTDPSGQFQALLSRSSPSLNSELIVKFRSLISKTYDRLASEIQMNERIGIYEQVRQIVEEQNGNAIQH
jgi:transposase-like protein